MGERFPRMYMAAIGACNALGAYNSAEAQQAAVPGSYH